MRTHLTTDFSSLFRESPRWRHVFKNSSHNVPTDEAATPATGFLHLPKYYQSLAFPPRRTQNRRPRGSLELFLGALITTA